MENDDRLIGKFSAAGMRSSCWESLVRRCWLPAPPKRTIRLGQPAYPYPPLRVPVHQALYPLALSVRK